jgi:diguanylate cyclase
MQLEREKPILRLVKSTPRSHVTPTPTAPADKARAYYRQMKLYAQKIRRSEDIDAIINILEEVLVETDGLRQDDTLRLAREEVERAERKINALRTELEETRRLVHVDHLTGALNRGGLDRVFAREAAYADRHATTLGVGLLDIDNFKVLNDVHGHQAGDMALVHLAQILRQALRPSDSVVRFGGEEFLLLLPHSALGEAEQALRRVREELGAREFLHGEHLLQFTFSAGVTVRRPKETKSAVIARADRGLYEAKRTGKHRIIALE